MAEVVSVNVGRPRVETMRDGRPDSTAIVKGPVDGRVAVRSVNLDGDDQADRSVHGGEHQAVYAYAQEDLDLWARVLERPVLPGAHFGENLTTSGVDWTEAVIGEVWSAGDVELELTSPRVPCHKLAWRMQDAAFAKRFARARRPGAYFRIVTEGTVQAGDAMKLILRPPHGITNGQTFDAIMGGPREAAAALLVAPQLHPRFQSWAQHRAGTA